MNFGRVDKVNVISHKIDFSASFAVKNDMNYSNDFIEPDYSNMNYSNENVINFKIEPNRKVLEEVSLLAKNDSQISTSGVFSEFSDFQNIMMADMCLLELLYENSGEDISGKTIGELYVESLGDNAQVEDYEKLMFTGDDWFNMANPDNWDSYRSKALGKMVRYGFGDIKIREFHQGENGFDAYVLEDVDGNLMVYYPCTNLVETEDFLYDSYNIIEDITNKGESIGKLIRAKQIYDSQQTQAKAFLEKHVSSVTDGKTVSVFGFSLGGSLAETSYLNSLDKHADVLGDVVLYNPYHDNLTSNEANKLIATKKLKIYACEGDMASTVFNYKEFSGVTKPIYVDSASNMSNAKSYIDNDEALFNKVLNYVKNDYCDSLLADLNAAKEKLPRWNMVADLVLDGAIALLGELKEKDFDAVGAIKSLGNVVQTTAGFLDKIGINVSEKYDLSPFDNLHYLEYMFTDTHLPYATDAYKGVSFDDNGNLLTNITIENDEHNVSYPSFGDESKELFGRDIYTDVTGFLDKFN